MLDFSPWDALLREYVNDQGRVDYVRWKREQPIAVMQWIQTLPERSQVVTVPDSENFRNEQLALWMNLYNAFTIDAILKRYPIRSIQPKILGIPNWIAFFWFFYQRSHSAFGTRYSLGQIESEFLRKQLKDPRIHFAIVCASIGCPLLRNEAYRPEIVQQQLDNDAVRFINNPDKVRYENGVLYCSKIFKWYRQDFLNVSEYINQYISNATLTPEIPIKYLNYDWSLNQQLT